MTFKQRSNRLNATIGKIIVSFLIASGMILLINGILEIQNLNF